MNRVWIASFTLITAALYPAAVFAAPDAALLSVYDRRPDLRQAFDPVTYHGIPGSGAGFLVNLEDWGYQFGWREYPELLPYAPPGKRAPVLERWSQPEPAVTAQAYLILDRSSAQVLAANHADMEWPIASLTKLMTAQLVLDEGMDLDSIQNVLAVDDVGGAKLYVNSGEHFTLDDLLYATLVGSANNAANAIARSTGLTKTQFVDRMNERVADMGMWRTHYADPTGIELENVSTAREISRIANTVFGRRDIRRYTTTAVASIDALTAGSTKTIQNTNWMLWRPEYEDLFVMAGKTGYLEESGWNFVVSLRPRLDDVDRELLLVVFGANSRAESFIDARALTEWAWENYDWP